MLETQRESVPRNDDGELDTTLLGLVQPQTDRARYWFGYTFAGDERWVLAHLTGETTRHAGHAGHAGHADILRELIDGTTGRWR